MFFFFQVEDRKKRYFGPRNTRKSIRDPRECRGGPPPPPSKKLKRKKMLRCEMGECRKRYDFRPPTPDFRLRDFLFTQPAQHGRRPSERPEPSATKASAGESVREEEPCLRGAARRVDWARDERGPRLATWEVGSNYVLSDRASLEPPGAHFRLCLLPSCLGPGTREQRLGGPRASRTGPHSRRA